MISTTNEHRRGTSALAREIDGQYVLTPEQIGFYRDNGYLHLKSVSSGEALEPYRTRWHFDPLGVSVKNILTG